MRTVILLNTLILLVLVEGRSQSSASYSLTVRDGLVDNSIYTIARDQRGFMWFGSWKGLCRYDTRVFKIYKNDPGNPRSLSSDFIKSSFVDSKGSLWVGTNLGLNRYNPATDSFDRFFKDPANENSLSDNTILSFLEDSHGHLWVGTGNGLSRIKTSNGKLAIQRFLYSDNSSQGKEITSIYQDPDGILWTVASNELVRIDLRKGKPDYETVPFTGASGKRETGAVMALHGDKKGHMWIGTATKGLIRFDRKNRRFHSVRSLSAVEGAGFLKVDQIASSKNGKLWLRTNRGALCFDLSKDTLEASSPGLPGKGMFPEREILTLYLDARDNAWLGTYADGVKYISKDSDAFVPLTVQNREYAFQQVLQDPGGKLWFQSYGNDRSGNRQSTWFQLDKRHGQPGSGQIVGGNCSRSYFDSRGMLWLGLFGNVMVRYRVVSGKLVESARYSLPHIRTNVQDWITAITEDTNGLIVGTAHNGLYVFDSKAERFEPYRFDTKEGQKHITSLLKDSRHNLWIGTSFGVTMIAPNKGKTMFFKTADSVQESASSRTVNSILEDNTGRIWMILSNDGLYSFDPSIKRFVSQSQSMDIRGHNITNLQHDNLGHLWLSNELGLVEYNIVKGTTRQFFYREGIPGSRMMSNSAVKTKDGALFFTTNSGGFYFYPDKIPSNHQPPPVVFTDLRLFNKPVLTNDHTGILTTSLPETRKISFRHHQSIFSIDFAVLNFTNPEKNQYAFKLEGLEKEWNYVKNPTATYTNLPAGNYTLLIKGANNDGVWNTAGARLEITVLPPWWNTWFAWIFYILLAGTLLYYLGRFFWLKSTVEREKHLQDVKLNFFTNISHEIRTRLMLISGPVDQLIRSQKIGGEELKLLGFVNDSSDNLLTLVNELMDFRKMESGLTKFVIGEFDVVVFVKNIIAAFEHLAHSKDIRTEYTCPGQPVMLWFDPEQFQKVIYNLLSNAYKFTHAGGRVSVWVKENEGHVEIRIADNGIGIAPEHLEKLFDNYFQVSEAKGQSTGYGVGLALAKGIVEKLKGRLEVTSQLARPGVSGQTIFVVKLSKGKEHFDKEQVSYQTPDSPADLVVQTTLAVFENEPSGEDKRHSVLLVEDNDDLRALVSEALGWKYDIIQAAGGEEGWQIIAEQLPDLVVSDVMMSGMDGLELCARIKSDLRTSHIPVILLTAKTALPHQLQGLESGAEAYLNKPLSMKVLELNIASLLRSRKAMQVRYSRHISLRDAVIDTGSSKEDEFLNLITRFVEDNIASKEIGVPELCRHVGMSKSVLYKKLRALTNLTINDFIKLVRFKVAARLLKNNRLPVQEVALSVGYEDRKYFSREFKKHFGKTPSEYIAGS